MIELKLSLKRRDLLTDFASRLDSVDDHHIIWSRVLYYEIAKRVRDGEKFLPKVVFIEVNDTSPLSFQLSNLLEFLFSFVCCSHQCNLQYFDFARYTRAKRQSKDLIIFNINKLLKN